MERDCCCNGCVHDFFTNHTAAAKETHGKLSRLKSEVEKRDRTRCVPCAHKGESKARICLQSVLAQVESLQKRMARCVGHYIPLRND
jgi:hypothetical protein